MSERLLDDARCKYCLTTTYKSVKPEKRLLSLKPSLKVLTTNKPETSIFMAFFACFVVLTKGIRGIKPSSHVLLNSIGP